MYDAVIEAVKLATQELKKKRIKFEIKGLLYLQGESDGRDAGIADIRAKELLNNLRQDLPKAKKMKMFIGGIAGYGGNQKMTRAKHQELAEGNKDFYFIDTSDLLKAHIYRDRIHFNNEAKMEIGKRFAKTINKAIKK